MVKHMEASAAYFQAYFYGFQALNEKVNATEIKTLQSYHIRKY